MTDRCPVCDGMTRGGVLCKQHHKEVADALHSIRMSTYVLLQVERREVHVGGGSHGGRPAFAPTPLDLSTSDYLTLMLQRLSDVGATVGVWQSTHIATMIRLLMPRVGKLASCPECAENHRQLTSIAESMSRRITPRGERICYGKCPNPLCGHELLAGFDADTVTCDYCASQWQASMLREQRHDRLLASDAIMTPRDIVLLLKASGYTLSINTIRSWARRGKITSQRKEVKSYRLGDVLALCDTPS